MDVPPTASEHPATWKFGYPIHHAETREAWHAWLAANHDTVRGVWWLRGSATPVSRHRERVTALEARGCMTEAGRRAVEVAQANGWWTIYDPVEDLIEPDDLAAALDGVPEARAWWDAFPPSARKAMLWWVISAARPDTRERRIATIVAEAEQGRRAQA